jgi:hypothetical protein
MQLSFALLVILSTAALANSILITVFTGVLALVAVLQWRVLRQQARYMRSVLSSERAWVIVYLGWPHGEQQGMLGESISFGVQTWNIYLSLTCQNHGRTPAWITEISIGLLDTSKEIPGNPPLEYARQLETPSDTLLSSAPGYSTTEQVSSDKPIASEEGRVVFGAVKYRDVYGENRQTTFGYRVTKGFRLERLFGYPEYNKHS